MKFFLTSLLLGSLVLVSPAVVSAASEATQEDVEGQAMIKPASSASEPIFRHIRRTDRGYNQFF